MQLELFPQHDKPLARPPHSHELPIERVEVAIEILVRLIVQTTNQQLDRQDNPDER